MVRRARSDEVVITRPTAKNILFSAFGGLIPSAEYSQRVSFGDDRYTLVDCPWVLDSITTDPVLSPQRYARDIFDCDDYVLYLKAKMGLFAQSNKLAAPLAIGFLFTAAHAFNFCIDKGSQINLINTQSNDRATCGTTTEFSEFLELSRSNFVQLLYL